MYILRSLSILFLCFPIIVSAQVGIGTNNPGSKLEIVGAGTLSNTSSLHIKNASNTPLLFVRNDGNVGIGTITPTFTLDVKSTGDLLSRFDGSGRNTTSYGAISVLGPASNGNIFIGVGGSAVNDAADNVDNKAYVAAEDKLDGLNLRADKSTGFVQITAGGIAANNEVARFTSNGNVGIGTISPTYKLDVSGDINASGSVRTNGVQLTSDIRFKSISETIISIDNISTIKYEWKDGRDERIHIGYGAQDVEKVLPDAVFTDKEGLKSVNYDEVHTYKLMQQERMIKDLQQQIEDLKKLVKRKRRIKD